MSEQPNAIPLAKMSDVNAAHTPGPWGIETTEGSLWVGPMRASGRKVDQIVVHLEHGALYRDDFSKRAAANARLISAAPDMLAALRLFVDRIEAFGEWDDGCLYYNSRSAAELEAPLREARAALARATTP